MYHVCSLRGYRKPCIMYSRMQNLLFASARKCVHAGSELNRNMGSPTYIEVRSYQVSNFMILSLPSSLLEV